MGVRGWVFHSSHRWFVGVLGSSRLRIGGRRSVDFWSQLPFFGSRFHGQMGTGEGGGRIGEEQLATKGRIERRKRGKVQNELWQRNGTGWSSSWCKLQMRLREGPKERCQRRMKGLVWSGLVWWHCNASTRRTGLDWTWTGLIN